MSQGQQSTARTQSEAGYESVEDPSTQARRRPSATVSIPRIIAGALAAASGAFASSWLGIAGTVTGAIVVSVIVSVATAVYTPPVERSHEVIQRGSRIVLETLPVPPHARGSTYVGDDLVATRTIPAEPGASDPAPGPGDNRAAATDAAGDPVDREDDTSTMDAGSARRRGRFAWSDVPRHWRRIVATTAVMLVAGFAVLTGFELAVGRSAESITGGGSGGTTLGHLVPAHSGNAPATTPSSTTPSSPRPSSSTAPSTTAPSTTAPSTSAPSTTVPSTGTPSSAPTSSTPAPTHSTP